MGKRKCTVLAKSFSLFPHKAMAYTQQDKMYMKINQTEQEKHSQTDSGRTTTYSIVCIVNKNLQVSKITALEWSSESGISKFPFFVIVKIN